MVVVRVVVDVCVCCWCVFLLLYFVVVDVVCDRSWFVSLFVCVVVCV